MRSVFLSAAVLCATFASAQKSDEKIIPEALLKKDFPAAYDGQKNRSTLDASVVVVPQTGAGRSTPPLGIDPSILDKKTDPCADFYQYACGGWLAKNPVPADKSKWSRFNELIDKNREILKDIVETVSRAPKTPDERKISDYYASCMNEDRINAAGAKAIRSEMALIAGVSSKAEFGALLAKLELTGPSIVFNFGSDQDADDANKTIAAVDQGGLSLPDPRPVPAYYLEEKFAAKRGAYKQHVQAMFALLGQAPEEAAMNADSVLAIETDLARASIDPKSHHDPQKTHHMMPLAEVETLTPSFDWKAYLAGLGAPAFKAINVAVPDFMKGFETALQNYALEQWKAYFLWRVVHPRAALLSSDFVDEDFRFYKKNLIGQKENETRWKRCVSLVDKNLGDALGRLYVEGNFGADGKRKTLNMVRAVEGAMDANLSRNDWMELETKQHAFHKLHKMTNKIGYPDKWLDYDSVVIDRDDLVGNTHQLYKFQAARDLAKIGLPTDRTEWHMSAPTVNAYYEHATNGMTYPAGILQKPFFSRKGDMASNYGAIGVVVGHELTHGFDDTGSQYDADGNLKNWWTDKDSKSFNDRGKALIDQYSKYVILKDPKDPSKDVKVDGLLTLGENIADNGGLRLAYAAMQKNLPPQERVSMQGFTPEQRFFLGFSQVWCVQTTEARARVDASNDYHSPAKYRVVGTVSNMPEFQRAFSCKADSPMISPKPNRVW
jgi:predicted metalloendopeptidase